MPYSLRRSVQFAVVVAGAVFGAVGCTSTRDAPVSGFPGGSDVVDRDSFVPGTLDPSAVPYVDGLAANFVEGARLSARLDEVDAACVATRWVAVFEPVALNQGGVPAEAMASSTLDRLVEAVPLDEPRVAALIEAFSACDVDYETAFLDSLLVVGQIGPSQRVCLADAMADGLLESITASVLNDDQLDSALGDQYAAALDACPA